MFSSIPGWAGHPGSKQNGFWGCITSNILWPAEQEGCAKARNEAINSGEWLTLQSQNMHQEAQGDFKILIQDWKDQ